MVVAARPAEGTGGDALQPGDVIYSLNANSVVGIERLRAALESVKPGDPLVLQIREAPSSLRHRAPGIASTRGQTADQHSLPLRGRVGGGSMTRN